MPEVGAQSLAAKPALWHRLSRGQWILLLAASALVVAAIVILVVRGGRPAFVPLYTNLNMDDAAAIVSKLKEMNVNYRLAGGGQVIMVPEKDIYETRLALASEGLPAGSGVGFEIFDKSNFGATEFSQKVNYLRALQGELTRTIMQMAEVEQARVHLVIPEQELYLEKEKPATASVMLKLKRGASLTKKQVQGIRHLVASAVEGMKPENVTVLDVFGNILSPPQDGPDAIAGALTLSQLEAKRAYEKELESSIAGMLEQVLGPQKASVRVNADIDFSQEETSSEIYEPGPGGQGIVRSTRRLQETFSSQGGQDAGQVPGVTTNVPAGLAGTPTYQASGGGGSSQQSRVEETTNYEITRRVEKRVKAPARIARLSVAAIIDGTLTPAQISSVTQAVSAAAGIDPARGDTIVVEAMPFDRSFLEAERQAMAAEAAKPAPAKMNWRKLLPYIAGALLGILAAIVLIVRTRRRAVPEPLPVPQAAAAEEAAGLEAVPAKVPQEEEEGSIEEKVERLAMSKPDVVARVVETLLAEEKG
ncbi:MAG TPA: flagellar M-ring protein FliF [Firmicutes bacterium]|nr:flagellar M-ring protein FliF [Bacillota bacterium]